MSKLRDAICAQPTRRRVPLHGHMALAGDFAWRPAGVNLVEYTLSATVRSTALVSEHDLKALPLAIREMQRRVIEEVFGEFRMDFRRIHAALWNHDVDQARDLLDQLEQRMFTLCPTEAT